MSAATAVGPPRRQPATVHPAARRLTLRFPGVSAWYGTHTGSWWAILPGRPQLLEAPSAEALERLIASVYAGRGQAGASRFAARTAVPPPRPTSYSTGWAVIGRPH
ncbi:hypothetical protein [Streptomonospora litoralis]|uniref:Uncharacterized protein n=1 Tax=Streptomonospora litoralis TaxID=2498135 RepID=A0A4P6Q8R3_9ACTN|nr:hypothetical protein [Streptomonospora litoralis]QBI55514.1 hypothetical protein EKD16_18755 [Streptomonospora litoralis]